MSVRVCRRSSGAAIVVSAVLVLPAPRLLSQAAGSGAAAEQSPIPTIRVETREVVLDVVVTDEHGHFVTGLTRDDFTVLEDKVKQRLVAFQAPEGHAMPADAPAVRSTADLQRIGNAPVTVLVLDELNTSFADMAYARGALEKWLNAQPTRLPQPTVLLAASDEKFAVVHDYTDDRAALLAALHAHFPSYPYRLSKGGSVGPDSAERMAMSLGTLLQIAEASRGTVGRKNLIWVGVGFPRLLLDDVKGSKEEQIVAAAQRATDAMLRSRVTLSVIDPTAMANSTLDLNNPDQLSLNALTSTMAPTSASTSGYLNFNTFAPATGGRLYAGSNDVAGEIANAVDNGSHFYTLVYAPSSNSNEAASYRSIQVVMRDPKLTATTRTGYFEEKPGAANEPVKPPATHDLAFDLMNAALSSIAYNGVHPDVKRSGSEWTLTLPQRDLQPHRLADGNSMLEVTVMAVRFDAKNRPLGRDVYERAVPAAGSDAVFHVPVGKLERGTARIRLVVRDAVSGRVGTVDLPVE